MQAWIPKGTTKRICGRWQSMKKMEYLSDLLKSGLGCILGSKTDNHIIFLEILLQIYHIVI